MDEYSWSKGFLAEMMQCSDNIPELEELLAKNRLLTAKEACKCRGSDQLARHNFFSFIFVPALNKELEHLCFDLVLVDTAHRNVEEERSDIEKAAKLLNEAYAKALQVESRLNSINLPELLGQKLQLNKMEANKQHNDRVEMVKKREEVLVNMESREIGTI